MPDVKQLVGSQFQGWLLTRVLGEGAVPSLEHGCDLRRCRRADYLAKLGLELTAPVDDPRIGAKGKFESPDGRHQSGSQRADPTAIEQTAG